MSKKVIYCNGDGFTAGVELADKDILPFYTSPLPEDYDRLHPDREDYMNKKEQFIRSMYVVYNQLKDQTTPLELYDHYMQGRVKLHTHISEIERKYAWPDKLVDDNTTIFNKASGGQSLGGMLHTVTYDLLDLKAQNIDVDLVILQFVPYHRIEFYDQTRIEIIQNKGNLVDPADPYYAATDAIYSTHTFSDLLIKALFNMSAINEIVYGMVGSYPIWVDSCNYKFTCLDIAALTQSIYAAGHRTEIKFLNNLKKNSRIDTVHGMLMEEFIYTVDLPYENCGHYTEEVHTLIAEKIKSLVEEHNADNTAK